MCVATHALHEAAPVLSWHRMNIVLDMALAAANYFLPKYHWIFGNTLIAYTIALPRRQRAGPFVLIDYNLPA